MTGRLSPAVSSPIRPPARWRARSSCRRARARRSSSTCGRPPSFASSRWPSKATQDASPPPWRCARSTPAGRRSRSSGIPPARCARSWRRVTRPIRSRFDVPVGDLPERPEPLRGVEVIVWAGDSSALTDGQRQTLERWVADGGQLLVVGGSGLAGSRGKASTDLLPLRGICRGRRRSPGLRPHRSWCGRAPAGRRHDADGGDARGRVTSGRWCRSPQWGQRRPALSRPSPAEPGGSTWIGADLAAPAVRGRGSRSAGPLDTADPRRAAARARHWGAASGRSDDRWRTR